MAISALSQIFKYFFKSWLKGIIKLVFLLGLIWIALDISASWVGSFGLDDGDHSFKGKVSRAFSNAPKYAYNWVHPGLDIYSEKDISPNMEAIYAELDLLLRAPIVGRDKSDQWRIYQAQKVAKSNNLSANQVMEIYVKVYKVKHLL